MSVNGITNSSQAYDSKAATQTKKGQSQKTDAVPSSADNTAAVYEKSDKTNETKKTYKADTATIEKLKAEAEKRTQSLRSLVEKMMLKQGQTLTDSTDIYALLREGKLDVDPETRAQAQKDIAEDGYWGVEQTSERILSFAKALSGGDASKANELIDAVKKGFEEATKAWGDELPGICKTTMDTAIKKLEAWRDGTNSSMSSAVASTITGQATAGKLAE